MPDRSLPNRGRLRVALLFGGKSAEHEVSVMSARNIAASLAEAGHEVTLIAITRAGDWLLCDGSAQFPRMLPAAGERVALIPGGGGQMVAVAADGESRRLPPVDVVFPALHGPYGEDGSVQGYAELAGVPYVGSGICASAVALDKDIAKRILKHGGLPVVPWVLLRRGEPWSFEQIESEVGMPAFVKPSRMGSSVGVTRATDHESLADAITFAARYDSKILVERAQRGREIEVGVLSAPNLHATAPGEIRPAISHGFYSYESKYLDEEGALVLVPADVSRSVADSAKGLALAAFRELECEGMARVDFFLSEDDGLVINEVNTLPGFTDISMFPKVWRHEGVSASQLVDQLLVAALERARNPSQATTQI